MSNAGPGKNMSWYKKAREHTTTCYNDTKGNLMSTCLKKSKCATRQTNNNNRSVLRLQASFKLLSFMVKLLNKNRRNKQMTKTNRRSNGVKHGS